MDASATAARRLLVGVAWAVPLLVIVQAALIGQALYGTPALVGLHGQLGNLTFLLAVIAVGLAWSVRVPRRTLGLLVMSVLLLSAQTGLGYAGHRARIDLASALHVGLGVALTAITVIAAMLVSARSPSQPRSSQD